MLGRDPNERHRAATPLELLFDLTFVVSFAQAGDQLAHYVAEGHIATAVWGFSFVLLSVCWAWINFTWFASAFDTDDWLQRILTMVQMVGVIVLALGIPAVFESIDSGEPFDFVVVAVGYVIMRVSLVADVVARGQAGSRQPARRAAICRVQRADPGRLADGRAPQDRGHGDRWSHCSSSSGSPSSPATRSRRGMRRTPTTTGWAPHGMPGTSPSGTDCS